MMPLYCFLLLVSAMFSDRRHKEFRCDYTRHPVIIDGELSEWSGASSIQIMDEMRRSENTVVIYSLWDDVNLYFAFDVKDADLAAEQTEQDHARLYLDDMVEFLIDPRNDKDSCWTIDDVIYHINILGQKKDDRGTADCLTNPGWNGVAKYSVRLMGSINNPGDADKGYIVEISIPWSEMEITPTAARLVGVNFGNGDNGRLFDWVDASPFRSPYAFGNLILSVGK